MLINIIKGFVCNKIVNFKTCLYSFIFRHLKPDKNNSFLIKSTKNIFRRFLANDNHLLSVLLGPISFQLLRTAFHIGLFQYLINNPGAKLEEISEALKITPYSAGVLLVGLSSSKLLIKIGDRYYNNSKNIYELNYGVTSEYWPAFIEYMHHVISPAMMFLQDSIIESKPMGLYKIFGNESQDYFYELSKRKEENQYFTQCMSSFSKINIETTAMFPIFSKLHRLLDVGGNTGHLAITLAKCNPKIRVTVYDYPTVVEIAEKNFQENNLSDRLDTIGGEIVSKSFPKGYDGILLAHFIDIFDDNTNKEFFRKAFCSLEKNGTLCILSPVVNDDESGPLYTSLFSSYFLSLANGKGRFYSSKQIISWLKESGFINIKKKYLPMSEVFITATKT